MNSNDDASAKPTPAAAERITWRDTRRMIRSDFERLATWYGGGSRSRRLFWFIQPNYQAMFWYRHYRYLYLKGWPSLARLLSLFSLYLTGVEISPVTSIGPACLLGHSTGIILFGKFGARFTIFCESGTGGGINVQDIGGGPGYPVVGDDVVFGAKAMALGAVRIGDRAVLAPGAMVTRDVPEDSMVVPVPPKIIRTRTATAAEVTA